MSGAKDRSFMPIIMVTSLPHTTHGLLSSLPPHFLQTTCLDKTVAKGQRAISPLHSQRILSAHSTRAMRVAGVAKLACLLARSDSRTPRAREQAVQTWMFVPSSMVFVSVSANGGHPTGTTAFATQLR